MKQTHDTVILGAGVTGLAAGMASGFPVFEARPVTGGICSSYYVRPDSTRRLTAHPREGDVYRFEYGGGHWIFGGDPAVLNLIESLAPTRSYSRSSAVFFPDHNLYVPYPLQNHLHALGSDLAAKAVAEIVAAPKSSPRTMADWLEQSFGPTLSELFFAPFHELYTAGLWRRIAPQDAYKSPADVRTVIQGALTEAPPVGYNVTYVYPRDGLNTLAARMAERCQMHHGKRVTKINPDARTIRFADDSEIQYRRILSTLPLNHMADITGLRVDTEPDPYTSVLVFNIGATKGPRCPEQHWIYVPHSKTGFHRIGFYSNVDPAFLPKSSQQSCDRVSIYVEKAFPGGKKPTDQQIDADCKSVAEELRDWGFIDRAEVVDPTWIDVAYTWSLPGSNWKSRAQKVLRDRDIHPIGRYGRWIFQGIADSIRDGLAAGSAFRYSASPGDKT